MNRADRRARESQQRRAKITSAAVTGFAALAAADPTLTGLTIIARDGEARYVSRETACAMATSEPRGKPS